MGDESLFDVAIIGGGPAGMAAAEVLGRQRRRTVLFNNHQHRNAAASRVHMVLGRDGVTPEGLLLTGRQELAKFPSITLLSSEVTKVRLEESKIVVTAPGNTISADHLILATGVVDQLPSIPGLTTAYGKYLFHCPLCDGFEVRDQPLAVIGGTEEAAFMAAYVRDRISPDVVLCANGELGVSPTTLRKLAKNGVRIVEDKIVAVQAAPDGVMLRMADVAAVSCRAGFLSVKCRQRSRLGQDLGCRLRDDGRVWVDHFQRSSVPNVLAVGDMARGTDGNMAFVATAIASGVTAAAYLDEDIFSTGWDRQDNS